MQHIYVVQCMTYLVVHPSVCYTLVVSQKARACRK